jgi:hypothetical protein
MSITDFFTWIRLRLLSLGPTEPTGGGAAAPVAEGEEAEGDEAGEGDEPAGDEPEGAEAGASDGGAADPNASGDGEGGASADENAESTADGSDAGATEADKGAGVAATTIRSSVEAKLAALKAQGRGVQSMPQFKFKPVISQEMLNEYQTLVDADKQGEAMLLLVGAGISQAFEAYHTNIVHPLSTQAAQNARDSTNNRRTADWERTHPEEAGDVELKKAMIAEYNKFADKHGVLLADEITLDELMLMARGIVPAKKGKGGKAGATESAEDEKSRRLAARAPGAVAKLRTGASAGKAGGKAATNPYIDHLKSARTDPF